MDAAGIMARVVRDPDTRCWMWAGAKSRYGECGWRESGRWVRTLAHRRSWVLFRGPIPDGLFVCHRCDTPLCVNPDHLFLGTHDDNMADQVAKGRQARGTRNAMARLNEDTVRAIRRAAGSASQRALARQFGTSPMTINRIIRRQLWRHVEGTEANNGAV